MNERTKVDFSEKTINLHFLLFTIFWWVGYPLSLVIIGLPFLIAAIVFKYIILYRHWFLLQDNGARTTSGKAVGFCFIPFYNFYWWFVAYVGLSTDNNRYMDATAISGPRMNYGLSVACVIVSIGECTIGLFPYIGWIFWIASSIIWFLFVVRQKNCILAIMKHRGLLNVR